MTKRHRYRDIGSIICNDSAFSELYKQSLEHIKLRETIVSQIDPSVREHLYVAGIKENTLVIYTDSPAWASKIRYSTAKIINTLTQHPHLKCITTIRIKIDPSLNNSTATSKKSALSKPTSRHLQEVANTINDTALQFSLLKLAQNK